MRTIQLTRHRPHTNRLERTLLDAKHYDFVIEEDTSVFTQTGSLLLVYRRDAIPRELCDQTFAAFHDIRVTSDRRGTASGSHLKRSVGARPGCSAKS